MSKANIWTDAALDRRCYIIEQEGHREISILSLADQTVNEAEYLAVIHALLRAKKLGIVEATLYSDSQLVVRQITGKYRKREPRLQRLSRRVLEARGGMNIEFKWVPREENKAGLYLEGKLRIR